jgi:hypothetical protein
MKEPLVRIRLDGHGRVYFPGATLAGSYRLEGIAPEEIRAVEVSILWHTEGKGDEDLAVHDFRRLSVENGDPIDPRRPGRFSTVLPNSPLSYRGVIVKIRWCVRVRVFLTSGREVVGEIHFRLGDVLPPRSATFWARAHTAEELLAAEAKGAAASESPPAPAQQPAGDATGDGGRGKGQPAGDATGHPADATGHPADATGHPTCPGASDLSPGADHALPKAEATAP